MKLKLSIFFLFATFFTNFAHVEPTHQYITREDEADDYTVYIDSYEYFAPNIGLVAKVEIRIVPEVDDITRHSGWWIVKYAYMITDFSLN